LPPTPIDQFGRARTHARPELVASQHHCRLSYLTTQRPLPGSFVPAGCRLPSEQCCVCIVQCQPRRITRRNEAAPNATTSVPQFPPVFSRPHRTYSDPPLLFFKKEFLGDFPGQVVASALPLAVAGPSTWRKQTATFLRAVRTGRAEPTPSRHHAMQSDLPPPPPARP
jgi:hypothetical protein